MLRAGNVQSHIYKTSEPSSETTLYSFDGDRMDSASGGENFDLDWDDNGNMTLKEDSDDTELVYNWDNKLQKGLVNGQTVLSVKYDPMGNRVFKGSTVNGNRKYVVDVSGRLPTILLEINPANGDIMKTYIHANGEILAQHDGPHTWARYFYLHDRLGSVRQVIDTDGWVKNYYTYNPFGELYSGETQEWITNPFKFTGQYYDSEIAEYYLRARQYDPHIGRFASRDPVRGSFKEPMTLHKYLYCGNDPVTRIDPTGELFDTLFATSIGADMYAKDVAMGGLALGLTYALLQSAAYQQLTLAFAASTHDALQNIGFALAAQWNKVEKMIYNNERNVRLNYEGGPFFNLPGGKWIVIGTGTALLAYEVHEYWDEIVEIYDSLCSDDNSSTITTDDH